MRKTLLVMALVSPVIAMPVFASTVNVKVQGKVMPVCTFVTPNDVVMTIPDMTPGIKEDKQVAADVGFWCSKGTTYNIAMDDGLNAAGGQKQIKLTGGSATDVIAYELTTDKTTGQGEGGLVESKISLLAKVKGDAYQNAVAGDYADTVVLTVSP